MQRLLLSALLLLSGSWAGAQTVQITTSNGVCTYQTGPVKSDPAHSGQLLATATSQTGAGCGTSPGVVSFGPASQLAPQTQTVSNSGGTAALGFQAVNAASCTGTVSGASGGTFASSGSATATICNSVANCTGLQSFGVNFPANTGSADITNTVQVTCNGATGGSANSSATVVVPFIQSPGNCKTIQSASGPAYTQWTGTHLVSFGPTQRTVDVTSFSSIYNGAWPGPASGAIANFNLPVSQYLSAKFHTDPRFFPVGGAPSTLYGEYTVGETGAPVPLSMTISTSCGDFSDPSLGSNSGTTVVPGCYFNQQSADFYLLWRVSGTGCVLQPNQDYYLNIIDADVSKVTPSGGTATSTAGPSCSSTCMVPIQNGPGSWQSYTPH